MKIIIILFLLIPTISLCQYNRVDTTWTLNYKQLLKIRQEIETCKETRYLLQDEIEIILKQDETKDIIISKLKLRDSLYQQELNKAAEIEALYREKLVLSNTIMNNYRILLLTTEEQVALEVSRARKERIWKNIYRYGFPAAILTTLIILK